MAKFKAEDAGTDEVGLRALRDTKPVGPNIEGSPTVASLSANVPGLGEVSVTGFSGSFDSEVSCKLRFNNISGGHAEGRCITKLAAKMDKANATGGSGTIP